MTAVILWFVVNLVVLGAAIWCFRLANRVLDEARAIMNEAQRREEQTVLRLAETRRRLDAGEVTHVAG